MHVELYICVELRVFRVDLLKYEILFGFLKSFDTQIFPAVIGSHRIFHIKSTALHV